MSFTTRFAPSPTGPLHLGHAYSALRAFDMARAAGGRFLLRIDDLDQSRARPEWETQIYDDLSWLGISWDGPVRRQSAHFGQYQEAIAALGATGEAYPCRCKRRDIQQAGNAPQEGTPQFGPDGLVYTGTCRARPWAAQSPTDAIRHNTSHVPANTVLSFLETGEAFKGRHSLTAQDLAARMGDPVLARAHMAAAYNFAVVLDDFQTGVTHIVRGQDLFDATFVQIYIQHVLGLPPDLFTYHHHRLIRDETGKRLAKRDDARAISTYRDQGMTPQDIRQMVGL